jgi:2-polyprenyl-3-methyl-5-hydroxy-6-metoxy-1,4-benzoquinol methylase
MSENLDNFDKFAHDYKTILDKSLEMTGETGEYFCNYKAACISRWAGKDFSGKILDYGCGVGLLSENLLKYFPRAAVDGYDVSAASIENVPESLKRQGRFTSDIDHLSRDYDLIIVANVLHHVEARERRDVVAKIQEMLRKEGKVIIFEHNPFNPLTRKIVRNSALDRGVVLLPHRETVSYLKDAGFEDVRLNHIVFFPGFLSALRWAEPFLSWFPLGAQYAAAGQAPH